MIRSAEQNIAGKFLEAGLNMQSKLSRAQSLARTVHVDVPKLANESDSMFINIPKGHMKTDKQLSHIDADDRAVVSECLKGCGCSSSSSSSSSSSKLKPSVRLGDRHRPA